MQDSNKQELQRLEHSFWGHPQPLRSLFFTELWERFSYYCIRPLLVLYMAATAHNSGLGFDVPTASAIVGIFGGALYIAPLAGGWLSDHWLGQVRSVWYGSLIIAFGHLAIALSALFGSLFFFLGLIFIVMGSGLFKTCICVMVGSLYDEGDPRRDGGFSVFYMGINIGAFISPLICGVLQAQYGWHIGFGVGGLGMLIALVIFKIYAMPSITRFADLKQQEQNWYKPLKPKKNVGFWLTGILILMAVFIAVVMMGFITLNPVAIAQYMTGFIVISVVGYFSYLMLFCGLSHAEKANLVVCFILLVAAAFFWASFDQQPTTFNLFAQDYTDRMFFGWEVPTIWFQSVNSIFIIIFAPLFSLIWIFLAKRNRTPTSITKFAIGLLFAATGFAIMMYAAQAVVNGDGMRVSAIWIILSLLCLTLGELSLSPVGLSTMTFLAPSVIKGQVMGLWFTASAIGNLAAGLFGGNVTADKLSVLPDLFADCAMYLMLGCIVLLCLNKPVKKMLAARKEEASSTN